MNGKVVNFSDHGFLVADDKAFLRSTIQGMLVRCRARTVEQASHGAEAAQVLARNPSTIDCVLCDWNMEPVDGIELLRAIRSGTVHNTERNLRVIMLTGHADEHLVNTALALDPNGYLVKPVSMDKLVAAVNFAFSKPTNLKSAETYGSINLVDLPNGALDATTKRIPPWVLWSDMHKGGRQKWAERIEQIRSDSFKQTVEQMDTERSIVNQQRLDLDDIAVGKILAEDIHSEEGHLLLSFGTVLTKSLLERLREITDDSAVKAQLLVGDFED